MAERKVIHKGNIGNALHNVAPDHITTTADEIFDEERQEYQQDINEGVGRYIDNPEFIRVEVDNNNRIVRAIKADGTEYLGAGVEVHGNINIDGAVITAIDNPEFSKVYLDNAGRILYGLQRDGNFYFGAGVPRQIIDYIETRIADLSLDEYEAIVSFLDGLELDEDFKTLRELLNEKVDKEEGKSLIDTEYASTKSTVDNPEFLEVTTDSEDKVLEGIQADGTKVIGADLEVGGNTKILGNIEVSGVLYNVIENPEYLVAWVDAENKVAFGLKADGKTYVGDADFLNDIKNNQESIAEIKTTLATIGDKVDSLDIDALTSITATESPEYIEATTDSEGKILAGRTSDGAAVENVGFATPIVSINGHTIKNIKDLEGRTEITTDAEGRIISYRDSGGVKHEEVGINTDSAIINRLNLTDTGMTEFQQALKDAGFQPGGSGDYTDKDSMYIPEPRLAHLNIITNFDLTNLTKTSDVKCQVEFTDGAGNYFKKWIILNGQGRSSLQFMKKGLGADFFNEDPNSDDFDEDNVFSIKFGDWVYQDSFHIKSYYTDWPRCTSPIVYKLTDEVVRTRGVMNDRPYKKYYVGEYSDSANANTQSDLDKNMETGARCFPDGFPVIVYQNGEFWGVNSWQLKKHRDNYAQSKKKATHIHLDGDFLPYREGSTPFWLYDGTIDWSKYCSGTFGIETRNPKNLYCIDGKKYDADSHDAEIITTATAEEWIAAGQIIPTGKTIDDTLAGYLRTTGKVRKNIEDLTRYIPDINRLISGETLIDGQQATTAQIKAAIEDRFDVNSFIDYILINNVVGNDDAWSNNGQIITWGKLDESDNLNWSVNVYDCDVTFGCVFNGTVANPADGNKRGSDYPLYKIFWDYYFDELKVRYHELRDKGIFDAEHITQLFRNWMDRVGYDNYAKEYDKWNESPCFRDGSQTYVNNPTTGGFYGSIERIYLWIKKRIQYMDAANFFDYHNYPSLRYNGDNAVAGNVVVFDSVKGLVKDGEMPATSLLSVEGTLTKGDVLKVVEHGGFADFTLVSSNLNIPIYCERIAINYDAGLVSGSYARIIGKITKTSINDGSTVSYKYIISDGIQHETAISGKQYLNLVQAIAVADNLGPDVTSDTIYVNIRIGEILSESGSPILVDADIAASDIVTNNN